MIDTEKPILLPLNTFFNVKNYSSNTRKISTIILCIGLLFSSLSFGATAIIVHPDNTNELKANDVRKIFLGKSKSFSNGDMATPIDLPDNNSNYPIFLKKVLRKSTSSLNAYWSRMMFSSKGLPPKTMKEVEAKAEVANNKNAIAYISQSNVDSSVKVILLIED